MTLLVDSLKIEEREEACPWKCPVQSREEGVFPYAVPSVRAPGGDECRRGKELPRKEEEERTEGRK